MSPVDTAAQAEKENRELEVAAEPIGTMLSKLGRRLHMSSSLLAQGAEAQQKAWRVNATIGIATEHGEVLSLVSLRRQLQDIPAKEALTYAPTAGRPELRKLWRAKLIRESPSLEGKIFGLPIVTSGVTHGLSIAGDLFVDPDDEIVLPAPYWENYQLAFEVRLGARLTTFPLFSELEFNVAGFRRVLEEACSRREKVIVLLNFPHNPSGYVPSEADARAVSDALLQAASNGNRLVVLCDDAYSGLVYRTGGRSTVESFFGRLVNLHASILAVKLDGATKELFAWGLRCGFLTFGVGPVTDPQTALGILDAKTRASIRAVVSSSPQLSQLLVERALSSPTLETERLEMRDRMGDRAAEIARAAGSPKYRSNWDVYPFDGGYFMQLALKDTNADEVRGHLLDKYGVGVVATGKRDLRIALSCLSIEDVAELFATIDQAVKEVRSRSRVLGS